MTWIIPAIETTKLNVEEIKIKFSDLKKIRSVKIRDKFKIKLDLVADVKKEAIKAYKVWGKKKFMGREFMGLIRSTFLLKDDKIIKEWRSVKVKDHAKDVLEFLKTV